MSVTPNSRVEDILQSKIDGTAYDKPPLSRVEALLLKLDAGGGTTNNYNDLDNKPSINGETLEGDKSTADLNLVSWEDI